MLKTDATQFNLFGGVSYAKDSYAAVTTTTTGPPITPPGLGGSAIGILFGAQAAGAAVGPICAGVLADRFGIMAAFYFLAGTIIVANLMIFVTPSGAAKNT